MNLHQAKAYAKGLSWFFSIAMALLTAGCNFDSKDPILGPDTIDGLSSMAITPTDPSIPAGLTQKFETLGIYADGTSRNLSNVVTWSSATTAVATIDSNGLATTLVPGTSVIMASFAGKTATTTLTVTTAEVMSISVTPVSTSVADGLPRQFTATGIYTNGTTQDITSAVTWLSSDINIATMNGDGAANSGLATGQASGAAQITATLGSTSGDATLTVTDATLMSIAVTPLDPVVITDFTKQLIATGTFSNGATEDLTASVTWSSNDTDFATLNPSGAADSGLATGIMAGTAEILASFGGEVGTITLTVIDAALLSSIAVTPAAPSIMVGATQQFAAVGTFTNSVVADITTSVIWSSSNTTVATTNPNLQANSGLASGIDIGTALIQAELNSVTGSSLLTVTAALANNPQSPALGETQRFAILASQTITTTTGSAINDGDMAIIDLARSSYAGFTPGAAAGEFDELTNGLSYAADDVTPPYTVPVPYASMQAFIDQVRTDLGIAATFLAADPNPGAPTQVCPAELGGLVLTRGVYRTAGNVIIEQGNLTLDAQGDPNSVFIFAISGTLSTGAPGGNIVLAGGALARNVYWRIGGTTVVGTNTSFFGNVFAWPQINLFTGATVTGRLFSVTEQVTLDANTVTMPQ